MDAIRDKWHKLAQDMSEDIKEQVEYYLDYNPFIRPGNGKIKK